MIQCCSTHTALMVFTAETHLEVRPEDVKTNDEKPSRFTLVSAAFTPTLCSIRAPRVFVDTLESSDFC